MKICKIPGMVIAGTGSGCGKTSVSTGIARYLAGRGIRVQTFKVGPDYLDPTLLSRASGRQCINLDSWMTDHEYVERIFSEAMMHADFALIEGVMGIFDGADAESLSGSTAEIASILGLPVYLIVNVKGMARTISAVVKGCAEFSRDMRLSGVIANYCSSERHAKILSDSLLSSGQPDLIGWFSEGELGSLPGRHLGLCSADDVPAMEEILEWNSRSVENKLMLEKYYYAPEKADTGIPSDDGHNSHVGPVSTRSEILERYVKKISMSGVSEDHSGGRVRIGIAYDDAFYFYYPDNLMLLKLAGAEIILFSPLRDKKIPENLDAIYIGGGYPELHAEKLSVNESMRNSILDFHRSGRFIFSECGGLMYLSESIEALTGEKYPMSGVFSFSVRMLGRRKALGYVEARVLESSLFAGKIDVIRGHEFHYSEIVDEHLYRRKYAPVYRIKKRSSDIEHDEGYVSENAHASYVHMHFASCAGFENLFLKIATECRKNTDIMNGLPA